MHAHGGIRHSHLPPAGSSLSWRSLFVLGLAGGIIPSTNALIILLATIATGRAVYGLVLVVAFGLGMAVVLGGVGLGLVLARDRMDVCLRASSLGRVALLRAARRRRPRLLARHLPQATQAVGVRPDPLTRATRSGRCYARPMRDLTDRALSTAATRGASYADVRIVRRLEESIAIKSGRVEGVASRGDARASASGSSSTGRGASPARHRLDAGRGRSGRRPGRPDRPRHRDRAAPTASSSTIGRPPMARYETPLDEDPFKIPLETKIGDLLAADRRRGPRPGHRLHRDELRRPARVEDVRRDATAASPSRRSPTSVRPSRPTPSRATSTSAAATRTPAAAGTPAATSTSASLDLAGSRRARWPRRRSSS